MDWITPETSIIEIPRRPVSIIKASVISDCLLCSAAWKDFITSVLAECDIFCHFSEPCRALVAIEGISSRVVTLNV